MSLSEKARQVIALIKRTKESEGGWRGFSAAVAPVLKEVPEELLEIQFLKSGHGRVRFSQKYKDLEPYL